MSGGTGITAMITRDDVTALMQRVHDSAQAAGLSLVMGRAVGNLVKDHLIALNAERHKYGRNYYAQAARSVTVSSAGGFTLVTITQVGIRQRLYGGPIDPINGQFLTIAACPEAYGKRAREFPDLQIRKAMNPDGHLQWALVQRASQAVSISKRKGSDGQIHYHVHAGELVGGKVMFWLVRHVFQKADPTVLPTLDEMQDVARDAGMKRINRLQGRATGGDS